MGPEVDELRGSIAALEYVASLQQQALKARFGGYQDVDLIARVETIVDDPLKKLKKDFATQFGKIFSSERKASAFQEGFRDTIFRFK